MKNIHVIPTDKPSRLGYLTKKGKEVYKDLRLFDIPISTILDGENQNIYITSDEELKYLDYYIAKIKDSNGERYIVGQRLDTNDSEYSNCKKIILTTDQSLIEDGIQVIDDEFLEWFVKNPSCEYVETKISRYRHYYKTGGIISILSPIPDFSAWNMQCEKVKPIYEIIIPKEELWTPKQDEEVWIKVFSNWSLGYYIGFDSKHNIYFVRQIIDDENSIGSLLTSRQKVLPYSAMPNDPKKETIKEACKKYYENNIDRLNIPREYYEYEIQDLMLGFANQWQQQNSLSEDDIIQFSEWIADSKLHGYSKQLYEAMIVNKVKTTKELVKVWIEKYKNNG